MSRRRRTESYAPFQTIDATARLTGLSRDYIRRGVKAGEISAIKAGSGSNAPYMIDTALFLDQLDRAAGEGIRAMRAEKNAVPGVTAPGSGTGSGTGSGCMTASDNPHLNYTMIPGWRQARIAAQLGAVHCRSIAEVHDGIIGQQIDLEE